MTSQQENINEHLHSNELFMKSVYCKVSDVRQILQGNQCFYNKTGKEFYRSENGKKIEGKITRNWLEIKKPQTSVNKIKINQQSTINREQYILNQRIKHSSLTEKKLRSLSNFSNSNFKKQQQQQKSKNQYDLTHFQLQPIKKFNLSNSHVQLFKTPNKSQQLSYQSANKPKCQFSKQQKKKPIYNQYSKSRNQNKMNRILGFLDKNDRKQITFKNKKKQQQDMNEIQEMTEKRPKTISSIQNYHRNKEIQKLKEEQLEFEQNLQFKPIGSAKTQRRALKVDKVSVYGYQNFQNKQKVNSSRTRTSGQKQILIVESKLSNYSRNNSALKRSFLQKGNRLREILYKKLLKQPFEKANEMVYVKEYDQWVPSELVENNKKQLQVYLQLLVGERKAVKSKTMTLKQAEIIYY